MSWRILKTLWEEFQQRIMSNSHYSRWKPPKATQVYKKHIIKAIAKNTKWKSSRLKLPVRAIKIGVKPFSIRIDKKSHDLIRSVAKLNGLTKSELLNIILLTKKDLILKEFSPPNNEHNEQIVRWTRTRNRL